MTSPSQSSSKEDTDQSAEDAGALSPNLKRNGVLKDLPKHPYIGTLSKDRASLLGVMWNENLDFQEAVVKDFHNLTDGERIELTKAYALHITTEIDELLKATGKWKKVLQEDVPPSISGINEELIDIFKFLINIALLWHITPQEFVEEFFRKSEVNWTKFKMATLPLEEPLDVDQKIIVFDLDGVLCKYPEHWISYLNKNVKIVGGPIIFEQVKSLGAIASGLERRRYDDFKRKYREEGQELTVPPMEGAEEVTKTLKGRGYKIIILTRRPVQTHKRLYADTISWLREHKIVFDGIFWSEGEKENELRRMFSKMPIVVEDDPEQASRLVKAGFFVLLLDRPYNRGVLSTSVQRVHSLWEIFEVMTQ